jgi:nucleoside-diphosphate-sugar epimerase
VYVDDVVQLTLQAIESDVYGNYNVGSGNATSLHELGETVVRVFADKNPKMIVREPHRPMPSSFAAVSIQKSARTWGYTPMSLLEGLARYRQAMEAANL